MKKKILFLSYYYSPCNATASNRPNSFVQNLQKNGFRVTVITRHWTGEEKIWTDYLKSEEKEPIIKKDGSVEIHYLPIKEFTYLPKPFSIFNTLWQNMIGNFNYELPFHQFRPYVDLLMSSQPFDYILVSTPPLTALKTADAVSRKFAIPVIVDVRDFENDILLYKKRKHGWLRQQQHLLLTYYFKKWIKTASIIFTASPPLTDYIKSLGAAAFTLNNGFNEALLSIDEAQPAEYFTITVAGTLYEMANLQVMLDACQLIFERHPQINIHFQFIGLMTNERVANMFRKVIPQDRLTITHRIPQDEALEKSSASHTLMLAGFDEMKGAFTTKIFEYLGLRRNIIQIPGDRDVVEEIITYTNSGKAPHTAEESYQVIMDWYHEWSQTGRVSYNGNMNRIVEFSREKQFEKLLYFINQ